MIAVVWPGPSFHSHAMVWQVTFVEFKVEDGDLIAAVGQVINRCNTLFDEQPDRKVVYALVMSLDTVQLCRVRRLPGGSITLECTKREPLSISVRGSQSMYDPEHSAVCEPSHLAPGVLLIARLLASPMEQLGFQLPRLPVQHDVGGAILSDFALLRSGGSDVVIVVPRRRSRGCGLETVVTILRDKQVCSRLVCLLDLGYNDIAMGSRVRFETAKLLGTVVVVCGYCGCCM